MQIWIVPTVALLAVALAGVAYSITCDGPNEALAECIKESNLPVEARNFKWMVENCDQKATVAAALGCYRKASLECSFLGAEVNPTEKNSLYGLEQLCQATGLNNDCLDKAMVDRMDIQICVLPSVNIFDQFDDADKFNCDAAKASVTCVSKDVTSCDNSTGVILAQTFRANVKRLCKDDEIF